MVVPPRQSGFIAEARQHLGRVWPLHVQTHGFKRNCTADGRVHGPVHYAHGALAQLPYNFISPDFLQSHSCAHTAYTLRRLALKYAWNSSANSIAKEQQGFLPRKGGSPSD